MANVVLIAYIVVAMREEDETKTNSQPVNAKKAQ